jgi:hypothetical protein
MFPDLLISCMGGTDQQQLAAAAAQCMHACMGSHPPKPLIEPVKP